MGFLTGKTAIITGAGRAVLKDGGCGSIGYGIATAYAKEGGTSSSQAAMSRSWKQPSRSWKASTASRC